MKNLVIDIGNTFAKIALFEEGKMLQKKRLAHEEIAKEISSSVFERMIVSDVSKETARKLKSTGFGFLEMSNELIFPFSIAYETPKTLGTDRLAAVAGACFLFPQRAFLCIDAGTCITYDFLDSSGVYQGGAISPGLQMRLKALNHFTGRLPLVNFEGEKPELIGKSTQKSILSGAVNGFLAEIRATVQDYQEQFGKDLLIVVTGGDAEFICKSAGEFFYEPDLLLIGLDNICNLNTV